MLPDSKRARFFWGVAFAWIPTLVYIAYLTHDTEFVAAVSKTSAVAGGFVAEGLVVAVGLGAIVALVLLLGSFDRGHWVRNTVAAISTVWSTALICLLIAAATTIRRHY